MSTNHVYRIYDLDLDTEGRLVMTIPAHGPVTAEVLIQQNIDDRNIDPGHFDHYKRRVRMAEGFVVRPKAIADFTLALSYHGNDLTKGKFNIVTSMGWGRHRLRAMLDFVHLLHCAKPEALFVLGAEDDYRDPRDIYAEVINERN